MKQNIMTLALVATLATAATACSKKVHENPDAQPATAGHTTRDSVDWAGTYTGTVPAASAEGIATRLTITKENTYTLSQTYIGKDPTPFITKGKFEWSQTGNTITLYDEEGSMVNIFAINEGTATQLDMDGEVITGELANNYLFVKVNPHLVGKTWTLTELNGQPVEEKATLELDATSNRFSVNIGNNNKIGTYTLKIGNRVQFNLIATTLLANIKPTLAEEVTKMLSLADSYTVNDNSLILNRARMAPLARFK